MREVADNCENFDISTHYARCVQSAGLRLHVVCPSVCNVGGLDQDHIGWKSWELIARTINPTPSLFVAQRPPTYSQGNVENLGRLQVGLEKVACWSTKAAIYLKHVKTEEMLLWRAYRKSPTLFRTVPSPIHYGLLFPNTGVRNPHPKI